MPRRRGVYGLILVSSYILNSANSVLLLMNTTCLHSMRLVEHLMIVIHRVILLLNIISGVTPYSKLSPILCKTPNIDAK
jgi:hypothetical protein